VLFEWTEDDKETPFAKARMNETRTRTNLRMLTEESTRRLDGLKISFGYIRVRLFYVPLELPLNVCNEIVRLADAHDLIDAVRAPTRRRMESKSSRVSGVDGLSAASNSQASNSGESSNGLCCWSRTERRTSLTSSLAFAQIPERTCSSRNASTSLAKVIDTALAYRPSVLQTS
jgi:hypothetical protein